MKQLKKDVIRELRRLKEDKINPSVFENIKKAKSEKQIAMVLLNFYMPDIFATCFMPEQFSMYWKEWSFKDYFKVAKKFVSIDKETVETSINVLKEDEALYEMDSVIYDFFQDRQDITEEYMRQLDSRKAMHNLMLDMLYDTINAKKAMLSCQIEKIDAFLNA